ncbi:MAG: hypothetical protein K9J37_16155 [Saprospiraceae bacterium]|nr:hypothetical protein [Saprospiraceae bacterium]MCF8251447.1 hypothetical protein [Saprospiraceae bacterium]MCF8282243.1 hypothetical protein [Bacteroidales bacterium]MCF8313042.1 hypothetical protein [Saprospiraceae bacterium]MCF8441489.1 hypothetical protein [Saprospiraceae bacterium]
MLFGFAQNLLERSIVGYVDLSCEIFTKLNFSENHAQLAETHLNQSVFSLGKAGDQIRTPLALLARSAYYRTTQNYPAALEEVLDIVEPSGMRLHLTTTTSKWHGSASP